MEDTVRQRLASLPDSLAKAATVSFHTTAVAYSEVVTAKSRLILLYITRPLHSPGRWKHTFQSSAADVLFLERTKPHIPNLEFFHFTNTVK